MNSDGIVTSSMYPVVPRTTRTPTTPAGSDTSGRTNQVHRVLAGDADQPKIHHFFDGRLLTNQTYYLPPPISVPFPSQAVDVFLAGTVIHPAVGSASDGHFSSLVSIAECPFSTNALQPALEAVALASFANRTFSADLRIAAAHRYTISLHRFRTTGFEHRTNALSVIACVVLLSMYEVGLDSRRSRTFEQFGFMANRLLQVVTADSTGNLNWLRHLHGLYAVLKKFIHAHELPLKDVTSLILGSWPFPSREGQSTRQASSIQHVSNDVTSELSATDLSINIQTLGISPLQELCAILPKVQSLFKRSATVLQPHSVRYESVLQCYRNEAIAIRAQLQSWSGEQSKKTRSTTIQRFTQPYVLRFAVADDLVCPITRADIYPDYFSACMWSSYRQCQLHLTDLIDRINHVLSKDPAAYKESRAHLRLYEDTREIVDDICASIPFMLIGESICGNKPTGSLWYQKYPPMLVGGFSLQWLFFTVSILEIVPMPMRQHMKGSLLWIGRNLGIGQATVMAQMDKNPPGGITARGDALRWTGFLL